MIGCYYWNDLPLSIRNLPTRERFKIKGPLGCLVSVKKRLKYTLLNSYYKSKCFARPQKACMLFTLEIFTGSSLKTFAPLKKIGVLRKFTISGDRESRDGGTF